MSPRPPVPSGPEPRCTFRPAFTTPDEAERKLIEWVVAQHDLHGVSWTHLAALVTKAGVRRANGDRYHQPWLHYALKAREAGYPGKDGWWKASVASRKLAQGTGLEHTSIQRPEAI